ncbi:hypothetical protein QN277_002781 [Acacia crassicarpa]|uniref:SAND domain-containing protein n=1 Tax=Acacia crassicarpa TaxID=499986 RepID=A0AAE1TJY8_9FABA|nr:hypothetical protein QN277_002781 [Acacia crassicarpa]
MANGLERESDLTMFSEDELKELSGMKRVGDYVEVTCGCTSHRYGDAVGRLRVFVNGYLEITCDCTPGCQEDKLSPAAFEKHSGRETARKWKNNVWVIVNGEKVPLCKTVLLKYYNQVSKNANRSHRSHNGRTYHRDEFIRCTRCNKERRFRLRTREECRIHHDALADANWKCSDLPYDKITCDDEEERASRRVYRGCTRSPTCKGCTSCVCFGCDICRFSDCSCQTCTDFTRNAEA